LNQLGGVGPVTEGVWLGAICSSVSGWSCTVADSNVASAPVATTDRGVPSHSPPR
jgi:hypothetical protein